MSPIMQSNFIVRIICWPVVGFVDAWNARSSSLSMLWFVSSDIVNLFKFIDEMAKSRLRATGFKDPLSSNGAAENEVSAAWQGAFGDIGRRKAYSAKWMNDVLVGVDY